MTEQQVSAPRCATPAAFEYAGNELDAMALAGNYNRWIAGEMAPHLGSRIVEAGAGIGTFSALLHSHAPDADLTLLEPAANNAVRLRERFRDTPRVRVECGYLDGSRPAASADTLVAVNVLEHVADDAAFLRSAHRLLSPNGKLLLFVPALPRLYGTLDRAFEHHRRYTRAGLRERLIGAGFAVERLVYRNAVGVVAWFAAGRILRRTTIRPRDAALYDRAVIPWLAALERRWSPPMGQSLLAIATRLGGEPS